MSKLTEMMEAERDRLNKTISDLADQRAGINDKIAQAEHELLAISAYEKAKAAKKTRAVKRTGGKRHELLDLIRANPGLSRSGIIEKLGIKGDKVKEQSISNALSNMKKAKQIAADDGNYTAL